MFLALFGIWLVIASPAPSAAAATPARDGTKPGSVSISFVGDTILGDTPDLPARPAHYLDNVEASLDHAQIVFGNLEGTLTTATASKCGANPSSNCFDFKNPPAYAGVLEGDGFDVLNSANNHSHDFGSQGVSQTSAALKAHGIAQTGLPRQIAVVKAGDTTVAFVGFAPYPVTNNLLDYAAARTLIHKADDEADLVVVYMHAGAEGAGATHVTGHEEHAYGEDRGNPRRFAHFAVANGADLVLASGPHVLRGMEFFGHRLIAYSLGDFASFHNFGTSGIVGLSGILQVTVGPHGWFTSGHLVSVQLNSTGRPLHDYSRQSVDLVRSLSNEDFGPHAARFADDGTIRPPA
jgi:poly-gamma-glutamate capsule biosynthesis protein CapA/YwtB (metallophosphatase superfamily)